MLLLSISSPLEEILNTGLLSLTVKPNEIQADVNWGKGNSCLTVKDSRINNRDMDMHLSFHTALSGLCGCHV